MRVGCGGVCSEAHTGARRGRRACGTARTAPGPAPMLMPRPLQEHAMKYNHKPGSAPASLWGPSYPGSTRFTTAKNEIMGRNNEYLAKMHERLKTWDAEV